MFFSEKKFRFNTYPLRVVIRRTHVNKTCESSFRTFREAGLHPEWTRFASYRCAQRANSADRASVKVRARAKLFALMGCFRGARSEENRC